MERRKKMKKVLDRYRFLEKLAREQIVRNWDNKLQSPPLEKRRRREAVIFYRESQEYETAAGIFILTSPAAFRWAWTGPPRRPSEMRHQSKHLLAHHS